MCRGGPATCGTAAAPAPEISHVSARLTWILARPPGFRGLLSTPALRCWCGVGVALWAPRRATAFGGSFNWIGPGPTLFPERPNLGVFEHSFTISFVDPG